MLFLLSCLSPKFTNTVFVVLLEPQVHKYIFCVISSIIVLIFMFWVCILSELFPRSDIKISILFPLIRKPVASVSFVEMSLCPLLCNVSFIVKLDFLTCFGLFLGSCFPLLSLAAPSCHHTDLNNVTMMERYASGKSFALHKSFFGPYFSYSFLSVSV